MQETAIDVWEEVPAPLSLKQPEWPLPTPLERLKEDLLSVQSFSSEWLPEPYRPWLTDVAERMQCPLEYMAVGSVVVTASLMGAGCSLRPKAKDSWTVIPNLWGSIVGAPSTLKTPALKEVMKPLEQLEEEAWKVYEAENTRHRAATQLNHMQREDLSKQMLKSLKKGDVQTLSLLQEEYGALEEKPAPQGKRYVTNDATIQKLHELLSQNKRGLLLFRDELVGFLASLNQTGHEVDRSFYLEAWNGQGAHTTDRIGRGSVRTTNLCLSILGSTQPSILSHYFSRALKGEENDGLLQRFQLLVYPDIPEQWELVDRQPDLAALGESERLMKHLSNMDFTQYGATQDEHSGIPYFRFSQDAQDIFYNWLQTFENRLRSSEENSLFIEHLTKYRKLLPALSLIFHGIHLAAGGPPGPIPQDCITMAIHWCDVLESHARRIYTMASQGPHSNAYKLAQKIQNGLLRKAFNLRDVYRKQWSGLKNREALETALNTLTEKGWLRAETTANRAILYHVNPQCLGHAD
jgi:putative DNA primase/helicase